MQVLDMETWKPMMADKEIKIIDDLIEERKPEFCLEWGSGNSTLYFPEKHECIKSWIAMEHDKTYLELLGEKISSKAKILVREANVLDYVLYPEQLNQKFDFILIDGLLRDHCLEEAFKLANPDAIILLHDASRQESAQMMERWKDKVTLLCEGEMMLKTGFYAHRGLALFKK